MTKQELANKIAASKGVPVADVEAVLEGFMEETKAAVASGHTIHMRGWGTIHTVERKAKTARDITKGTPMFIPAHNVPKVTFSKAFMAEVKESGEIAKHLDQQHFGH